MRHITLACALAGLLLATGCASGQRCGRGGQPDCGRIIYVDGAGGSGLLDWSDGLRQAAADGGFEGQVEVFRWQTGLGFLVDHTTDMRYKRDQGRRLAARIQSLKRDEPDAPVYLVGYSAGSAVVVTALEELHEDVQVESVALLASSLGRDYDLLPALRRVRRTLSVFASERDAVLAMLVPLGGTADRASGWDGTLGCQGPSATSVDPRLTAYERLEVVHWQPSFAALGHDGGHEGVVQRDFAQTVILPRLLATDPHATASRVARK